MVTYENLMYDIKQTALLITEGNNEGRLLHKLKDKISKYVSDITPAKLKETLPNIINQIKTYFSGANVKYLLTFLVTVLLTANISLSNIKEVFVKNDVDKYVTWTEYTSIKTDDLKYDYETGEYEINEFRYEYHDNDGKFKGDLFSTIENNIVVGLQSANNYEENTDKYGYGSDTITKANMVITMDVIINTSKENNKKFDYANDDTQVQKQHGGALSLKRKLEVRREIEELERDLRQNKHRISSIVNTTVTIKPNYIIKYSDEKSIEFKNIIVSYTTDKKVNNNDTYVEQGSGDNTNPNANLPTGGDGHKDITALSKNYQFVELLKLGGIETDRTEGDKRINPYADWIIDTRKHPKRMLRRLQTEYPEYNIEFDMSATAKSDIHGAMKGMSNMGNQYQEVAERSIFNFKEFLNENNTDNTTLRVWQKILGSKFPNLTKEQAEKFDNNVQLVIDYLEQMYGSSVIGFKYSV